MNNIFYPDLFRMVELPESFQLGFPQMEIQSQDLKAILESEKGLNQTEDYVS